MPRDRLAALLDQELEKAAVTLTGDQKGRLLEYLALLHKWNQAYNLTAVRNPEAMISRHLLDSLALLPYLDATGGRILDVGTGPGLPGIPLAIARPDRRFILLDSNGKKTRFLFQVQMTLELDTVDIVGERIEQYVPDTGIRVIVSRAFASLVNFWSATKPVWQALEGDMTLMAMKGADAGQELRELEQRLAADDGADWNCRSVALAVPGNRAGGQLVILRRQPGKMTTETRIQ